MKKLIALLCIALLTLGASLTVGCNPNLKNDDSQNYDGVLRVGMECNYQPYNWTQFDDSNGAVPISGKVGQYANGYDVKIAKKIADSLGKKLEIYAYDFNALIPAVQSGTLDLIIAGMSPTAERLEEIDFSVPYLSSDLVIVVRKDGAFNNASSLADFNGAKIVAQQGTFHDEVVDQITNVQHVTAMATFPDMINALNAKSIDGYVAEETGAIADCNAMSDFKYIPLKNNDTGFMIEDLSNVTISIGLKKGSLLLDRINEILNGISQEEKDALRLEAINQASAL